MKKEFHKLYYSISEVSELMGVKAHVLRYWETQFPVLKPKKNRAGNRTYRVQDIKFILTIKSLLYNKGYTIAGARQKLRDSNNNPDILIEQLSIPFVDPEKREIFLSLKNDLLELKELASKL
ncbi:MAG: MerR family transcriptional regulator [Candidatus Krumholzibacteriota bacterium]|nr:MerR family transcriptional regulator [Candidatus Krumholzibacteriota bacterium]